MISVIQLVSHAHVSINDAVTGAINHGILALIGLEKSDTPRQAEVLIEKIINYRIFPDGEGKTNLSLIDIQGGLLLVPQFTLVADTQKGTRPGFSKGMTPSQGKILFEYLQSHATKVYAHVASGQFGANMQITLCNDGPMTFIMQA